MTQLCFNIILFRSINQNKSLVLILFNTISIFFRQKHWSQSHPLLGTPRKRGSMLSIEMVTVSDTLKAQGFFQTGKGFEIHQWTNSKVGENVSIGIPQKVCD